MSPTISHVLRSTLTLAVLTALTALLASVGVAAPSTAATASGSFYVLRSQATGKPAAAADNARCDAYLGTPRKYLTIQRLDAVLNAPAVATATGQITNGEAVAVTPAYLCAAIGGDGALAQSYARTALPSIGTVELAGPCNPALGAAQPGTALVDCRLSAVSAPAGITGLAQTNSVDNPLSVPGAQTGSLITAYVIGAAPVDDGRPATGAPAPVEGANFWVLRAGDATTQTGVAECPSGWRARVGSVRAAQPSATTGRVLPSTGPTVGRLTTCYSSKATTGKVSVRTTLQLTSPAKTIKAEGDCTQQPLAATPGTVAQTVAQTCGLNVKAPALTIEDGLVSGTVLVPAGDAAGTVDAGVWTATVLT